MSNAGEKNLVGSRTLAALFGVTTRRIQQLANEGVLTVERVKGVNKFDQFSAVQEYVQHLEERLREKEEKKAKTGEMAKLDAEVELKQSRAAMVKLQLKELEGKMHRSEDVEALTTDLVYAVRSALLALPGRLAVDLSGLSSPQEISVRMQEEVHRVLNELAAYQYDPEEYAKRVRERQGWDDPDEEEG